MLHGRIIGHFAERTLTKIINLLYCSVYHANRIQLCGVEFKHGQPFQAEKMTSLTYLNGSKHPTVITNWETTIGRLPTSTHNFLLIWQKRVKSNNVPNVFVRT